MMLKISRLSPSLIYLLSLVCSLQYHYTLVRFTCVIVYSKVLHISVFATCTPESGFTALIRRILLP